MACPCVCGRTAISIRWSVLKIYNEVKRGKELNGRLPESECPFLLDNHLMLTEDHMDCEACAFIDAARNEFLSLYRKTPQNFHHLWLSLTDSIMMKLLGPVRWEEMQTYKHQ